MMALRSHCSLLPPQCATFEIKVGLQLVIFKLFFALSLLVFLHAHRLLAELWLS